MLTHPQYLGWLDVPLAAALAAKNGDAMCVEGAAVGAAWAAMVEHESQLVWFRRAYLRFSTYVRINTLRVDVPLSSAAALRAAPGPGGEYQMLPRDDWDVSHAKNL